MSRDHVLDNSRLMIREGSKSFSAASRLFDASTRRSAYFLYAWCRYCDDQIDGQTLGAPGAPDPEAPARRLASLYGRTRAAFAGKPMGDDPVFLAFQRVVARHRIPARYPLELLDGFRMDVEARRYEELEDTLHYCYHVAGVVGVMMAHIMGVRDRPTLLRAADLGIAFQLTNIARDVMDDAKAGRVYLPARWLREAGLTPALVDEPARRAAVFQVVRRILAEAERYYDSAAQGMPRLGLRSAWAVATARGVYRDIGRLVLERKTRAWDQRAVVSRTRKIFHGLGGGCAALCAVSVGRLSGTAPREGLWTMPERETGSV